MSINILLKMYNVVSWPFKKVNEVNGRINLFTDSIAREFAKDVSARFRRGSKIVNYLSYVYMRVLLDFAVTAWLSIPLSLLISYFYVSFLISNPMAYNVYATHLLN
jgi:hypothetical protein